MVIGMATFGLGGASVAPSAIVKQHNNVREGRKEERKAMCMPDDPSYDALLLPAGNNAAGATSYHDRQRLLS